MAILADDDIDGMDTELAMSENQLFGFVVRATGVSHERLDCDCPRCRHHGHFADYGRQRGILRPRKYTQLLQHPRDD